MTEWRPIFVALCNNTRPTSPDISQWIAQGDPIPYGVRINMDYNEDISIGKMPTHGMDYTMDEYDDWCDSGYPHVHHTVE